MPPQETSGLGRNGPWLQNQWLRVETRQTDGSISPVALDGGFRPTERAVAFVEPRDATAIAFDRSDYDVRPYRDALGDGRALTLTSRVARRGVTLRVNAARPRCLFSGAGFAVRRWSGFGCGVQP